jgi:hypothetical protein
MKKKTKKKAMAGKTKKLHLYVWEEVLTGWDDGIMFALATSPAEARKLLLKKSTSSQVVHDSQGPPRRVDAPEGFVLWGGS